MQPLEGVRVLDFTIFQQGPQASLAFSDMGADVIKVEAPRFGDLGRVIGMTGEDRLSPYFLALNRGKRSITLNLTTEEAKRNCLRLAEDRDVMIHHFSHGGVGAVGLG